MTPITCFAPLVHLTVAGVSGATDDFDRSDEDLIAPPWVSRFGILLLRNDRIVAANRFIDNIAEYDGGIDWRANHRSVVTLSAVGYNDTNMTGPAARVGPSGAYVVGAWLTGTRVMKVTGTGGAARTILATDTTTWVDGDRCELRVQGTTLKVFKNGTIVDTLTCTDSSLTSGRPGLYLERGQLAPPASRIVQPGLSQGALSGLSPRIRLPRTALPGLSQLALAGFSPSISQSSTFPTPNIKNKGSFEHASDTTSWGSGSDWDNFNSGSGSVPGVSPGIATDRFKIGSQSVKRHLAAGAETGGGLNYQTSFGFAPYLVPATSFARSYVRWYTSLDANFDGTHKMHIVLANGVQLGGVYWFQGYLAFVSVEWLFGGNVLQFTDYPVSAFVSASNVFRSIECDWHRGPAPGYDNVAIYVDDVQITRPDGAISVSPGSVGYWQGGRIYVGMRTANTGSSNIDAWHWGGIKNAGSTVVTNAWYDAISISSLGRCPAS